MFKSLRFTLSSIFTHRRMVGGEMGIYPAVKVLMGLKQMAFGAAPAAFMTEFEMGKT